MESLVLRLVVRLRNNGESFVVMPKGVCLQRAALSGLVGTHVALF